MKKFIFPLRAVPGTYPVITQAFGDPSRVKWYRENGMDVPFHNGTDAVLSGFDRSKTYGAALICPFPKAKTIKTWFDAPMSKKGNGIMIQSEPIEDSEDHITRFFQMLVWHCSDLITQTNDFLEGDVIAYVGNSGLVTPSPTPECVFCGSHVHIMMFEYRKEGTTWIQYDIDNGVSGAQNPMNYLSLSNFIIGEDTGIKKDLSPFSYFLEIIKNKILEMYPTLK